eukprot:241610-Prymnesium_polylepis.1
MMGCSSSAVSCAPRGARLRPHELEKPLYELGEPASSAAEEPEPSLSQPRESASIAARDLPLCEHCVPHLVQRQPLELRAPLAPQLHGPAGSFGLPSSNHPPLVASPQAPASDENAILPPLPCGAPGIVLVCAAQL